MLLPFLFNEEIRWAAVIIKIHQVDASQEFNKCPNILLRKFCPRMKEVFMEIWLCKILSTLVFGMCSFGDKNSTILSIQEYLAVLLLNTRFAC